MREVLARSVERFGSNIAFTLKLKDGSYRDITYIRYYEDLRCLGEAMIATGLAGQTIGIIGKNSYAWFLAHLANQFSGGISVMLDKDAPYNEFVSNLVRTETTAVFYDVKERDMVLKAMASGETKLAHAIPLYECEGETDIFDLLEQGKEIIGSGAEPEIDKVVLDPDRVSHYFFTSGTTSLSKIVMLSQWNISYNTLNMCDVEPFWPTDTTIMLLPYHHTFGSGGQWVMLASGIRTVYCDGLKYLQKNLKEYGVTFFVGVPLLVEAMYSKIMKTAEKEGLTGRINTFSKVVRNLNKIHIDIRRNVFKSVLDALGGKLRFIIIGASAADPKVVQAFNDFGVFCIQGYGLTETSPVLIAEQPGYQRLGSIGVPMKGVEIDLVDKDENGVGEIIARAENVMKGYLNDPEATAAVIKDGWFYTGDLAYRDKDGFYFITGRKKNVIVLHNGKNVSPEELESMVDKFPYQLENIVLGVPNNGDEKDPVITLKLVYDPNHEMLAGKSREEIEAIVNADVDKLNDSVQLYKRIKRVYITDEPMEKTSTGKVKKYIELEKILAAEQK